MRKKIIDILRYGKMHLVNNSVTADKILSLMGEKEIGGSGADSSDGDLHIVRECNARPSIYESVKCVENKGDTTTYSPMFEWHWKSVLNKWNTRH